MSSKQPDPILVTKQKIVRRSEGRGSIAKGRLRPVNRIDVNLEEVAGCQSGIYTPAFAACRYTAVLTRAVSGRGSTLPCGAPCGALFSSNSAAHQIWSDISVRLPIEEFRTGSVSSLTCWKLDGNSRRNSGSRNASITAADPRQAVYRSAVLRLPSISFLFRDTSR